MRELFKEWRSFINEEVEYEGILKAMLDSSIISELEPLQALLPEKAVRLSPKDLHLTLIHQSILKPFRKQLKNIELPDIPPIILDDEVFERSSPGKKSWAVRIVNQEDLREYVAGVMSLLGSSNTNPEPERVFHISLANLTGNPHDSVR